MKRNQGVVQYFSKNAKERELAGMNDSGNCQDRTALTMRPLLGKKIWRFVIIIIITIRIIAVPTATTTTTHVHIYKVLTMCHALLQQIEVN